jgi:hypothetical protein
MFGLIAALQQRQHENAKEFLDRCKTAWYGLLRKSRVTYPTEAERAAHDGARNEGIKCMFVCGMRNEVRLAVKQIAGNTETIASALAAAVQYESANNIGVAKPQRYGIAPIEVTPSSPSSAPQASPTEGGNRI